MASISLGSFLTVDVPLPWLICLECIATPLQKLPELDAALEAGL